MTRRKVAGEADISRSEKVELDAMIRRRDDARRKEEGDRPAEEMWAESERRYFARRSEENRAAW
jgi:hypothetical protein